MKQKCLTCNKKVVHLSQHLRTHEQRLRFRCTFCDAGFNFKQHLEAHVRTHTLEKPNVCNLCFKEFNGNSALEHHCKTAHEKRKEYYCIFCGVTFAGKNGEIVHLRRHIGEKPFSCQICGFSFCLPKIRDHHLRSHVGEKIYKCKICGKSFSVIQNMRNHEKTHRSKVERRIYRCRSCKASYMTRSVLKSHENRKHKGVFRQHSCVFCLKQFNSTGHLSKHILNHVKEKPYSCKICENVFAGAASLRNHESIVHAGKRLSFRCTKCNATLLTKYGLKMHEKRVHLRLAGKHGCLFCSKKFHYNSKLFDHLLGHTNEKPFHCQYCDESFYTYTNRRQHMELKHSQ